MALIKHAAFDAIPRDAIVLDLAELSLQGERLIQRAREKAGRIVADAEAERRRLVDSATADGFGAGQREGLLEGVGAGRAIGEEEGKRERITSLESLERAWQDALTRFEGSREAMLTQARIDVLELALRIARKVTRRAVDADPGVAGEALAAALELVGRPTRLRVRACPADIEGLRRDLPALAARFAGAAHLELAPDESLSRGSIVAATDAGEIDATIETQIDRIVEALLPGSRAAAVIRDGRAAQPDATPAEAPEVKEATAPSSDAPDAPGAQAPPSAPPVEPAP